MAAERREPSGAFRRIVPRKAGRLAPHRCHEQPDNQPDRNNRTIRTIGLIETPSGEHVPLGEVADVTIVAAPNTIKRASVSRRIDVTCNVRDRDLGSVARDIESQVRHVRFDRGSHPEFLGEYAAAQASRRQMILMGVFALAGIIVLLYSEFRAWRHVTLVMLSFVFALIGGVVGVWIG